MTDGLEVLFTPLTVGSVTLRNRFVMPGMQRGFTIDGGPAPRMVEYLRRCAAGGAGLIISESTSPDHPSAYWQPIMGRLERATLPGWQRVVDAVKGEGAAFLLQLWHPGAIRKVAESHPWSALPALSPSGLIQEGRSNGRALSRSELEELLEAYVRAARDAQHLGADGIEIHAAHGYLLDQFLWAETNRRDDGYGGDTLAERARFPAEIAAAIARDPEDLRGLLQVMRAAGVDLLNVSSRRFAKPEWPHSAHPEWSIAEWAKSLTDAPVMTCGSVGLDVEMFANLFDDQEPTESPVERDLATLAERVRHGRIDLVGVGRAHIANNDFVAKVRARRFGELALFNKAVHLADAMAAVEPGFVEEGRKIVAAE